MRIGIDIGGTTTSCALINNDKKILSKTSFDTNAGRPYTEVLSDVANSIDCVVENEGLHITDIEAIGVGCPGIIDQQTGCVIYSNNIAWKNVPLAQVLQEHVHQRIYVDNDANCAALGEYICGAAQGSMSSVTVTLGTGVGGGIILDGQVYNGFNFAANAVGHTVIVTDGEQCTCGRKGCWETYASVTALIRMAEQAALNSPNSMLAQIKKQGGVLNGKSIFEAARAEDSQAVKLMEKYFFYVAEGIINIINVLQPEIIVIGGGISHEGDYLLNPVKKYVEQGVYCKEVPLPQLAIAKLNNDAGIIGAAYLKG